MNETIVKGEQTTTTVTDPSVEDVKAAAAGAKDRFVSSAKDIAAETKGVAEKSFELARHKVKETSGDLESTLQESAERAREAIVAKPMQALGLAVGAGLLLGMLASRRS